MASIQKKNGSTTITGAKSQIVGNLPANTTPPSHASVCVTPGSMPRPNRGQSDRTESPKYRLSKHAIEQAHRKGVDPLLVLQAATNPTCRYENRRHPGQMRHIRDDIVAVVGTDGYTVVTFYANVDETAPRADQTDADALEYARRYNSRLSA